MKRLLFTYVLAAFTFVYNAPQSRAVTASQINALGTTAILLSATNLGSSIGDCVCNAYSSTCPQVPWGTCAMIGLTAAQLGMSLSQDDTNSDSGTHFDPESFNSGFGSDLTDGAAALSDGAASIPKFSADDISQVCERNPSACNECANSGDFSNCTPQLNISDSVANFQPSDPEIANALDLYKDAVAKINDSLAGGLGDAGLSDQVESGFANGEEVFSDPLFLKKEKKKGLGAADGEGLGNVSAWGMDLVDEKTGKKLTLFQRARRRYYDASQNKRLNYLARAEFIRAKAINHAKKQKEKEEKMASVKPAVEKSPERVPASEVQAKP